ncbi:MAG: DUF4037 domain-containing protein, partial [Lachnospiraceae bacterium]|nr:DUF4037 domain-containing protein [Lachnospiraceae bacterium]
EEAASTGTCADGSGVIPWEEISVEALFTMQENLIYYDPRGLLGRVRALTAPENYPDRLWKKSLLAALRELREGMHDLRQDVRRGRFSEAQLHLGRVVEHLFHTGFLAMHRYYPWHTHLRWAWDRLEPAVLELGRGLERLEQSAKWSERLEAAGEIFDALREYITRAGVFPEIDLYSGNLEQEFTWAERLAAWDNPGWRDFIRDKMDRAVAAGYPPDQFWVWSLWGLE